MFAAYTSWWSSSGCRCRQGCRNWSCIGHWCGGMTGCLQLQLIFWSFACWCCLCIFCHSNIIVVKGSFAFASMFELRWIYILRVRDLRWWSASLETRSWMWCNGCVWSVNGRIRVQRYSPFCLFLMLSRLRSLDWFKTPNGCRAGVCTVAMV